MAGLGSIGGLAIGGTGTALTVGTGISNIHDHLFNLTAVFDKSLSLISWFDKNCQATAAFDKTRIISVTIEE